MVIIKPDQIVDCLFNSLSDKQYLGFSSHFVGLESARIKIEELLKEFEQSEVYKKVNRFLKTRCTYKTEKGMQLPLFASMAGMVDIIKNLKKVAPEALNITTSQGETILGLAVNYRRANVVKSLIGTGQDFNQVNLQGLSLVHQAVDKDCVELIEALALAGADLNKKMDSTGFTPAHLAVYRKHPQMIEALALAKADFNAGDDNGLTAAHYAAHKGDVNVLRALHRGGADLFKKTKKGHTPLDYAKQENHQDVINFFNSLTSNCVPFKENPQEITSEVIKLIDLEIARLQPDTSDKASWFSTCFLKGSERKIKAFSELKEQLQTNIKTPNADDVQFILQNWYNSNKAIIKEQRNVVHAFFVPSHETRSFSLVKRIFSMFDVKMELEMKSDEVKTQNTLEK